MMLRKVVLLSVPLALCACASTSDVQTGFVGSDRAVYGGPLDMGPTNARDPRLSNWRSYMDDEGATPRWLLMTPQPNR